MARLPQVGGDVGNWGEVLNDFLAKSHNPDGTLKNFYLNVKDKGAIGNGTSPDTDAIHSANSLANNLMFSEGIYYIDSNLTLSKNLHFQLGAKIKPKSGVTVTIAGQFAAPLAQIFDLSDGGAVVFGPGSQPGTIYPQWFGAVGNGRVNDTLAVIGMFRSIQTKSGLTDSASTYMGPRVHFPAGRYLINADTLLIDNIINLRITGDGSRAHIDYAQGASVIMINGAGTNYGIKVSSNKARNFTMEHIAIEYNSNNFTGNLVAMDATGFTLRNVSVSFDNDSEVSGSRVRWTARAAVAISHKEGTLDRCTTTGSQYGVLLATAEAQITTIRDCTLTDHPIAQLATAPGISPLQGLEVSGTYFNVVRLGSGNLAKPLNAVVIKVNGFSFTSCWFSGALSSNRWSGEAIKLQGAGTFQGNNVKATVGAGVVATGTGTIFITGNSINGAPPIIIDDGLVVEEANDLTVSTDAGSNTHVNINPNNKSVIFRCGPSIFRSNVPNSYLVNPTGQNQVGTIYTQTLRNASMNDVSAPASIHIVSLDKAGECRVGNDLVLAVEGKSLRIKEGKNAKMGTTVLSGGVKVVSTTGVTANSRILLTSQTDGGIPGFLRVSARSPGSSFTIKSSSNSDTSTIAWFILEPA